MLREMIEGGEGYYYIHQVLRLYSKTDLARSCIVCSRRELLQDGTRQMNNVLE